MNRTRTSKNAKRLLVWLLLLTMVFGLLPMAAFADEAGEPVVIEEPVQEPEPLSESTEAPSEPTQEPTQEPEPEQPGNAVVTIEGDEEQPEEEPTDEEPVDEEENQTIEALPYVSAPFSVDASNPIRVFHLDCGRKYFSAADIIAIIDLLAENNYTHLELAIGNEGLRFLFEDMSITANDKTYDGAKIKNAIISYNNNTGSSGYLSEADMESIFTEANKKGISIIPLLNSPGHMNAIIAAMEAVDMTNVRYKVNVWEQDLVSDRTIDLTNTEAVNFTQALIEKYAVYFQNKGCKYFNIGTDEYANDLTIGNTSYGGFASLSDVGYSNFVTYVNNIDNIVKAHGMRAIAFNDGFYYAGRYYNDSDNQFNSDIIISYWSAGYTGYSPIAASELAAKGHSILNTHERWYYVLGRRSGDSYTLTTAQNGVKNVKYNKVNGDDSGSVTPIGCMICLWCDSPTADYSPAEVTNVAGLIETFSEKNSDVFKAGDNGDVIEIRVPVGETKTEVVSETEDVRGSFKDDDLDESTALVSPDYINTPGGTTRKLGRVVAVASSSSSTGLISDGTNYMVIDSDGNISSTTDINDATEFTVTRSWDRNNNGYVYTIKGNGKYLTVSNYTLSTSNSSYSFSYDGTGFCYTSRFIWTTTYYLTYSASGWKMDESLTKYGKLYSFTPENKDDVSKTVLTITGVAVGTTYCEINGKTYKIIVEDKAPDGAMTSNGLTLEYWITNYEVYDGQNTRTNHTQTITTSTAGALTEDGVAITTIAPNPAYSFFDGQKIVYYWQAMRLDADNKQTNASSVDSTGVGTTLTHVRYHGGAWQYKTVDGVWHYFLSTDQLVAYYLQKTEVTKEIDSYVKDWGYGTDSTTPNTSDGQGQVALTVAVVYPDGTVSPTEGQMYANSTTIFNYWDGRDIGIVAPTNNSEYTISKITVTDGTRDSNSRANVWYTYDSITWEKTTNAAGSTWYDETEVWNESSGTTPMVNGKTSKITWSAKNTAKLVLIYLKPVEKETNLTVKYINLSANNAVFHQYQVAMKYATGEATPTFTDELRYNDTPIGGNSPWSSNDPKSSDYLPDEAYVINSSKVEQKFKKDITTIPEISGLYASGLYGYVKADITDEGKTLNLYYKLKPSTDKTYVVDFGLPIVIPFADFNVTNLDSSTKASFDEKTEELERTGNYGTGTINMTEQNVTYSLFKMLDALTPIPVYFKDTKGNVLMRSVNVIPASNVYYEDSFVTFNPGSYGDNNPISWTTVKSGAAEKEATQKLSELGSGDIYGFDKAYEGSTEFSMGSAQKVTVTSDMANATAWPTATFTFKGTGFDIISLTDNTSGSIFVDVYQGKDTSGGIFKSYAVNNYFGYKKVGDTWEVSKNHDGSNPLYQIPVMKVTDLDYGDYTVVVTVFYDPNGVFNSTGDTQCSFWFDAVRIYNPMGKDVTDYTSDHEGYPQYIKLRTEIGKSTELAGSRALFIDGAAAATVEQYKNYGPNNEVYLGNGQAISFKLPANTNIATVQIGAKSPNATKDAPAVMNISGNDVETEIATATEMYYNVSYSGTEKLVTITNNGDAILSLTNIKITYTAKETISLAALTDSDAEEAVAAVRALFAAPVDPEPTEPDEPEKTFEPELKWEWSKNVRKGGRAILTVKTSTDVDYIVVDGVTYDKFITRTERAGRGWNAPRVTYREFIYMMPVNESGLVEIPVIAGSYEFGESAAITTTLNVKESSPIRDWIGGLFGRWF